MIRLAMLVGSILGTLAVATARAELPAFPRLGVDGYLRELARVEHSTSRISMEPLFARADSLEDYYLFGLDSTRSIEWLPESEIDSLQVVLRGIDLATGGDFVFAVLDSTFFGALAKAKGLPQDVEFMKAYLARELGKEWMGDCAHFGADRYVNQHLAWRHFIARYPHDYVRYAAAEDQDVIEGLVTSECVCGDSASLDVELKSFLRHFPNDAALPSVKPRLESLHKGTSEIEFHCIGSSYH